MKISIKYSGVLAAAADNIEDSMGEIIRAAAEEAADSAREMCPVETGALRGSISVTASDNTAYVTADKDYAAYVEFGTSKMPPQPFLVPSVIENSDNISAAVFEAVRGKI